MYKEGGYSGFFVGLNAMNMKMIPLTAIAFTVNDFVKTKLNVK